MKHWMACLCLVAGGCGANRSDTATAQIHNAGGEKIGTAIFEPSGDDVRVRVEASGLPPGPHGIHVHEVGRCEGPDFSTAGSHFSPGGATHHGGESGHAGDLPNLQVNPDGTGRLDAVLKGVTTRGQGDHSLFHANGTSIVIHRDADDLKTSPSGGSGERIACGVIVAGN